MRVPRDQGEACGGAVTRERPAVRARGTGIVGGEQLHCVAVELTGHFLAPQPGRESGEQDVVGEPHPERRPALPGFRGESRGRELGCVRRRTYEAGVDSVDIGADPGGRLLLQRVEAAPGRVVEPGPAGEAVPRHGARAEEGGGGALGAVPFQLQSPGTVAYRVASLGEGQPQRIGSPEVRDAPGVPVGTAGGVPVRAAGHDPVSLALEFPGPRLNRVPGTPPSVKLA